MRACPVQEPGPAQYGLDTYPAKKKGRVFTLILTNGETANLVYGMPYFSVSRPRLRCIEVYLRYQRLILANFFRLLKPGSSADDAILARRLCTTEVLNGNSSKP